MSYNMKPHFLEFMYLEQEDSLISLVYAAQTNPGSTRVKTNPGCVYTTIFQTNPGRTRVSSVYTTN